MAGYLGRTTNTARDNVGAQTTGERDDMAAPVPAVIVASHGATVDVRPTTPKRGWDGEPLEAPVLYDVPLEQMRGAAGALTMPAGEGDYVMLHPVMRDASGHDTGGQGGIRTHNISDYRATLTGGDPLNAPLANPDPDNMHLRFGPSGGYGIKGSPDGRISIEGREGNAYTIIASALRELAGALTVVSGGSSAGSYPHTAKAAVLAMADKLDGMAL